MNRYKVLICIFAVAILIQGCTQETISDILDEFFGSFGDVVVVDPPDSSPPEVKLVFQDPTTGKQIELNPGDPEMEISIKNTDRFYVIAVAEDPQGVKELTVYPVSAEICKSNEGIGCKVFPLTQTQKISSSAGPGDSATTKLWLPRLVDGDIGYCPPPCELQSVSIITYADAENFSGLRSSSSTVVFTVQH